MCLEVDLLDDYTPVWSNYRLEVRIKNVAMCFTFGARIVIEICVMFLQNLQTNLPQDCVNRLNPTSVYILNFRSK